ncbi:MAG: hypothetical protein A2270_06235 [Elusimicrobia bacterium RIFOXYA12_FULL_51_18]|nr:MAG: hypothetical protein A2270_06235 [Elusimicrobia bacterium RIFOXYA12_FULL_51_18]OGS31078.1 MAG: hypothetical protein A2218_01925 [Elusimicrobia bacterium RIFOXYA2_FULL_53_38]
MENHSKGKLLWRKAAVLGSLWAASEIIFGSFLHNAHLPFAGESLTFIGIIILISGHRLWPEPGLLWRAGFVCAAMKSVSPSAVIFGPMIAISMEGIFAEAGVSFMGGNFAGYALGGGLAMCWALAQKLLNLLIYYGPDAVSIYLRGAEWLRLRCGFGPGNLWAPLILLFAVYFLAGASAALSGMRSGKGKTYFPNPSTAKQAFNPRGRCENTAHEYSIAALGFHVLFMSVVMAVGRKIPAVALLPVAGVYGYICARSYPRVRGVLKRTGVWAGVLFASLTAGIILGSAEAGFYMALRAFLLTLAFAAIGYELVNPVIRGRLERLGGGAFFETLEYAFCALPGIIEGLPSGREFARRPLAVIGRAVARAPFLLDSMRPPAVFIITGGHGSGKSTLVSELAEAMRVAGKKPGGILAEGLWENGLRAGFDLVALSSGRRVPLCRRGPGDGIRAGKFLFFEEGLAAGLSALSPAELSGTDAVFLDEVGSLELEGGGWSVPLKELCRSGRPLVLVVRNYLVERVAAHFNLGRPVIWKIGEITAATVLPKLLAAVEADKNTDTLTDCDRA